MNPQKYDVKRALRSLYAPPATDFVVVDVPPIIYVAIDGHGDPNTSDDYALAVEALYSVAYGIKFGSKRAGRDFVVAPLEGLWFADDPEVFVARDKSAWSWTMLIAQPDWISEGDVADAVAAVRAKAAPRSPNAALGLLRLRRIEEGRSAQILHVGPYDDEAPTLARLHDEWLPAHGFTFNGPHHEIYLSDPRRAAPEKLRTILRQPVRPLG